MFADLSSRAKAKRKIQDGAESFASKYIIRRPIWRTSEDRSATLNRVVNLHERNCRDKHRSVGNRDNRRLHSKR